MKRIYFLLLTAFASLAAFAQDGGSTKVDVNLGGESGASNIPWLWIIGGLVFVILLVALLNNRGGGRDRIVEKKTVIKD